MIKHCGYAECVCDVCGVKLRIGDTVPNAANKLRKLGWTVGMKRTCCCPNCQKNNRKPYKQKELKMPNKIPNYIKAAIRRRAAAAEKYFTADLQISEYCRAHGLDTEFIDGNAETVTRFDAEFFIRDVEESLERRKTTANKTQEGG